jgi:hypothetical protein
MRSGDASEVLQSLTQEALKTSVKTTTQHSLQGGTLLPYPRRTFTGWNAPASPGAQESVQAAWAMVCSSTRKPSLASCAT